MTIYVLGIGANVNALHQCRRILGQIRRAFGQVWVSELVTTKAVGIDAPDYVNGVVCFESDTDPQTLLEWCKALERQLGRDRSQKLCAADIDLLLTLDHLDGRLTEDDVAGQVEEPWFRPLVTSLFRQMPECMWANGSSPSDSESSKPPTVETT